MYRTIKRADIKDILEKMEVTGYPEQAVPHLFFWAVIIKIALFDFRKTGDQVYFWKHKSAYIYLCLSVHPPVCLSVQISLYRDNVYCVSSMTCVVLVPFQFSILH